MSADVVVMIDDGAVRVVAGITVAAAIAQAGIVATRRSCTGAPRSACCGMGVCFECRVRVDGVERLGCLTLVAEGMEIRTDA
jgi:predicted molibdopterin-dependent oxidoreductase YjgC